MPAPEKPRILTRPDGATIAYRAVAGAAPGIIFLSGFRSAMTGAKELFLNDYFRRLGRAYIRFDYFGHGVSSGDFADGTIGRWADDAIAVIDSLTAGPQILVGSSMGGWIMLLAADGARASMRFLEFFAANTGNPHTRRAYYRAAEEFLTWCARAGGPGFARPRLRAA